jgi:hypothetical protein
MRIILPLLICLVAPLASAEDLRLPAPGGNYYEALAKPSDTYDDATKLVAAKLAKSRVPTHEQAERIALRAFISKPDVQFRLRCLVSISRFPPAQAAGAMGFASDIMEGLAAQGVTDALCVWWQIQPIPKRMMTPGKRCKSGFVKVTTREL